MAFTFPADCNTARERAEFCLIAAEKLRLLHNQAKNDDARHEILERQKRVLFWAHRFMTLAGIQGKDLTPQKQNAMQDFKVACRQSTKYAPDLNQVDPYEDAGA